MDERRFSFLVRGYVSDWYKRNGMDVEKESVIIVWQCKTLQNNKALAATDIPGDNRYFELTYNGDKQELYLDVYEKKENNKYSVGD